ncbi:Bacteriophage P22, Gp10, DNA-stabilising [uncultured Caudovirales phage]|uniref:Bacteriophage P22, Gp10, DNA-stabilising n=1 Tax=uncultured Caudovirales phage TaxID=2100421 RepID=A0A6J7X002_9CAUD|nr:Bacteriophage P22, Gp10, DNA-stabilising [uncultured Caudovirales phage]
MQIPILNGIYTDSTPELRTSYPVNLVPVPKQSGISNGFLRPGDGIVSNGTGPGIDRGGINWQGSLYRVMGTKLVEINSAGAVTVLGDVGGPTNQLVTFDYSFDQLAIASGGRLFYWSTSGGLVSVTDPDLGVVLDVVWVDGYFMTTDGEFLVVTELSDPTQVNPLKYGSSEVDPDPVVALLKLRNEVYALNRNTIEVFDNVGGELFPFARIDGAQIQKGVIGTQGCCVFIDRIAFLGSARNEAPGIYVGASAVTEKISTQEIDNLLLEYTQAQLALVKLEARNDKNHEHLYVHLPDRTIVFDASASKALETAVWFTLTTTLDGFAQYRARNMVWVYDKWMVGDPQSASIGYLVQDTGHHWGQQVRWEFGTLIVYNESNGAIFNEMELVSLTGSIALGENPQISTSYSLDGQSYSQEKFIAVGTIGNRKKRLAWFQQGHMRNWRIQRFRGDSDAHVSYVRLEAQIEALAY